MSFSLYFSSPGLAFGGRLQLATASGLGVLGGGMALRPLHFFTAREVQGKQELLHTNIIQYNKIQYNIVLYNIRYIYNII